MHQALRSHPEVSMASVKETEYFNTNLDKGRDWYESKFPHPESPAVGEISNNYYLDPVIAKLIRTHNPKMKIVFNLRDPEDLLRSMYSFGQRRGLPFYGHHEDLEMPIGRVMGSGYQTRARNSSLAATDTPTLFEASLLSRYIAPYLENFDSSQVHFFILERMKDDPSKELALLYEFLDVDPSHIPESADEKVNDAIVPKSQLLAKLATTTAFKLRGIGADRLLTSLHDSEALKKVLFRRQAGESIDLPLNSVDRETLARERGRIGDLVPEVASWWPA